MLKRLKFPLSTIFVGCTHIDHAKPHIYEDRGFASHEAHAEWIITEIALYAKANPGAQLVHLGDGFLNSTPERARAWLAKMAIPIWYLFGNHEGPIHQLYKAGVEHLGFPRTTEIYPLQLDNVTFLGHETTVSIEDQHVVCHHFPFAIWDKSHKGAWHVHSHSHHSFPASHANALDLKRLDVGVDSCLKYFGKPYITFAQLKVIMDRKQVHVVDHHTPDSP